MSFRKTRPGRITITLSLTVIIGSILILGGYYAASRYTSGGPGANNLNPPYPPSSVIEQINFDLSTLKREAPGSDIWATGWADDGNLYTSWGDGGGFGGTNYDGRVSMGVARIEGTPEDLRAFNVWGGFNPESNEPPFPGKAEVIVSIDGVLYMPVSKQDVWNIAKMTKSSDHGRTWISGGWDFYLQPTFLDYGQANRWAPDSYLYSYTATEGRNDFYLMRVPKDKIMIQKAYELFAGLDRDGHPIWSDDPANKKSVFTDPNGIGWWMRVVYNRGVGRYLLTTSHGSEPGDGSWGIFDAPDPWGPWTTVAYYSIWIDSVKKICFQFPSKWISPDGKTLWMIFSGRGIYDSFNVVRAELKLKTPVVSNKIESKGSHE
jgi:Domain of unknown function (DUF4185)